MKNLKKVIFALMVVFLVVGFIGCKTESDPPKTPVVTNNFKGKTFLGMTGEGEDAYYAGYIIFTSDKDCEVMFFDEEPMPATYTVADDVATLTGTGEYAVIQLSTTKLTDGKFSITIPPAVSKEEEDIVVSYEVGTLWTILYDIPDSDEDFSWKMPEEELEAAVENFGFEEDDYTKDDATKTITLTASGYAKVQALIGGGSGGDDNGSSTGGNTGNDNPGNTDTPETPVVTNNFKGNVFVAEYSEESDSGIWGYIEFIDDTNGKMGISNYDEESNPIITDQLFTYSVTDDVATIKATMYGREVTVTTSKLTDGIFTFSTEYEDSTVLVTCTKGDKSLFDVWTVYYDEEEVMKDFFYEFEDYVELLVEEDDYSKDDATKTITLTASGYEKVQDAMGGGSEDEEGGEVTGWTVMYNGTTVETFESFEEVETFASSIELVEDDDYTVDYENQIITLTASGYEKVQDAMGGDTEGGDSGEVYYYMHNGELYGGQNTLEDFLYEVELYDLVEGTDYEIDHENMCINFTDSGCAKLEG